MKHNILKIKSNGKPMCNYINVIVDIRDFGAFCDGVTDDTAAIEAARRYKSYLKQYLFGL